MNKTLAIDFTFNCDDLKIYLLELANSCSSALEFMHNILNNVDIQWFIIRYFKNYNFKVDVDEIYKLSCNYLEHYWSLYILHVDWTYSNLVRVKGIENVN